MPRPPRIHFAGAIYHAYARGVDGCDIFIDDQDRRAFLATMRRVAADTSVRIIAYCLMRNHFHFAVQVGLVPLSTAMHRLLTTYCMKFNRRHNRTGHLFGGRHRTKLCKDDWYLAALIRYIHMNPVRAGLVSSPGDWPWSSYKPGEAIGSEIEDFDPWPKETRAVDMMRCEAKVVDLDPMGAAVALKAGISLQHLRSARRDDLAIATRRIFVKKSLQGGHTLGSAAKWLGVSIRSASRYVLVAGPDP